MADHRTNDDPRERVRMAAALVNRADPLHTLALEREVERLTATHRGAADAVDDAFQVILDALSSLHPEPAKRLMETPSYKAFSAYVKRGQSVTGTERDHRPR